MGSSRAERILSGFGRPRQAPPAGKRNTPGPAQYNQPAKSNTADRPSYKPPAGIVTTTYFDHNRGGYWHQNNRGNWIQLTEASVKRFLRYETFAEVTHPEESKAMIDRQLMKLQTENDVDYAGSLAGYKIGLHEICGRRFLITDGPKLLVRKEGRWDTFRRFVETLLGEQTRVFYGWLRSALISLYSGAPFRPGQMLAIAGPAGSGKSLLQNLITELLGGRMGKPYRYMIGDTSFNSDLLSSEHLMIEDEAASTDLRVRRTFGSMLKNMIVNEVQSLHRKGRDALPVTPFWRVTITLNDEPENMMVLPPLDESVKDKIILLRATPFKVPYAVDDIMARNAWRLKLSAELPAFMHWLRSWRVPPSMVNVRYGVNAFQDARLAQDLEDLSPESKLLRLIDALQIWDIDRNDWKGTAADLEDRLIEKDKQGRVAKLLSYNSACGVYLARLAHRFPDRITALKEDGKTRRWSIKPLLS
jgi:energy-coupling factor transporter ATP-binding protein EcfA2